MDKNVCAYYRTSSNTNVGNDKDSKKRQQHSVRTYAQSKGLNVVREFYDKGVSGTLDVLNRPSFMEMLNYCEENKVSIIIKSLDNLSALSKTIVEILFSSQ